MGLLHLLHIKQCTKMTPSYLPRAPGPVASLLSDSFPDYATFLVLDDVEQVTTHLGLRCLICKVTWWHSTV